MGKHWKQDARLSLHHCISSSFALNLDPLYKLFLSIVITMYDYLEIADEFIW